MNNAGIKKGDVFYIYHSVEIYELIFDKYWKAIVINVKKIKDTTKITFQYPFDNTTVTIAKETGKPFEFTKSTEDKMVPLVYTEADYFNGVFEINDGDSYNFPTGFKRQYTQAKEYKDSSPEAYARPEIYYIYGAIEGNYDWYWKAERTGKGGDIFQFTYTVGGEQIYVPQSELDPNSEMALITTTARRREFRIFTESEYFDDAFFDINDNDSWNFRPDFVEAYESAQENYKEAAAASGNTSGGNRKLRF